MTAPTSERPLAVVTGASSGIDLLIAAEDAAIGAAAEQLRTASSPRRVRPRTDFIRE